MMENVKQVLSAELKTLEPCKIQKLVDYLALLFKWNQAYNLTAVRDVDGMARRHVLDSLAALPWINGTKVLDVGTGAGLPGIPLAIARPDLEITLLDSNGKKTRFLQEVKRTLSLTNINIIQMRVESYRSAHGFDTIISRAFSQMDQMINLTQHLLADHGIWLAMKSVEIDAELQNIQRPYQIQTYTVPHVPGQRCCVIVQN
jgi:16S rRNA (guanine527-N7)-methyltransferase